MKRLFVDYMAYLGYLMQLDENKGLTEKDLNKKYNMYERVNILTKCSNIYRQKLGLPLGTYQIKPLLHLNNHYISEKTLEDNEIIAVEINQNELQNITIPYNLIYILKIINQDYYKLKLYNIFIMNKLSNQELESIEDEKVINYYLKYAKGILYSKEINEDGTISLVKLHNPHENLNNSNLCYICDDEYPETLQEIITYLKEQTIGNYIVSDLPIKEKKNIFKRIRNRK